MAKATKKSTKPTTVKKVTKKSTAPAKASKNMSEGERVARLFHDTYEKLAPDYGYETRPDTKQFDPKKPNGKLMIAVAKEIIKQTKKPTPKPKVIQAVVTEQMLKNYFFKLTNKQFVQLADEYNEDKLKFRIVKQKDYDHWINYFKSFSANQIRQLAVTGLDILPTEAYAALARWHDIISNPSRIDKIHQTGLTEQEGGKPAATIAELAAKNDRLGVLKATRAKIAARLDKQAGARDTAALADQMTDIMTQIEMYEKVQGPKKDTVLGSLLSGPEMLTDRKRGKGARNTSFASRTRVTIDDLED